MKFIKATIFLLLVGIVWMFAWWNIPEKGKEPPEDQVRFIYKPIKKIIETKEDIKETTQKITAAVKKNLKEEEPPQLEQVCTSAQANEKEPIKDTFSEPLIPKDKPISTKQALAILKALRSDKEMVDEEY